jgi:hypothetical protein
MSPNRSSMLWENSAGRIIGVKFVILIHRSMWSRSSGIVRIGGSERGDGQGKADWYSSSKCYSCSDLRSSLILLGGINRENGRSLILRNKAGLVRRDSRIGSSSSEVCFCDVAIPDTGVSAHMLPDDQDEEGNIV